MDTSRENVERFNEAAPEWDSKPDHVRTAESVARAMRSALRLSGRERALEFGAGTGLVTLLMAPDLAHITAMDASPGMLAVLREKCSRHHLAQITVVEGGVPKDLPEGPFDLIYSCLTLHHVEDVPALLRALAPRLRNGGFVALADLDAEDGSFHAADVKGVVHHGFERGVFTTWLRDAGFSDARFTTAATIEKQRADGTPGRYTLFLAVASKPQGSAS